MSLKNLGDVSYFRLNNEINRPVNGQIPLNKDKEALFAPWGNHVKTAGGNGTKMHKTRP